MLKGHLAAGNEVAGEVAGISPPHSRRGKAAPAGNGLQTIMTPRRLRRPGFRSAPDPGRRGVRRCTLEKFLPPLCPGVKGARQLARVPRATVPGLNVIDNIRPDPTLNYATPPRRQRT